MTLAEQLSQERENRMLLEAVLSKSNPDLYKQMKGRLYTPNEAVKATSKVSQDSHRLFRAKSLLRLMVIGKEYAQGNRCIYCGMAWEEEEAHRDLCIIPAAQSLLDGFVHDTEFHVGEAAVAITSMGVVVHSQGELLVKLWRDLYADRNDQD